MAKLQDTTVHGTLDVQELLNALDINVDDGVTFNQGAKQTRPVIASNTAPSDTNAIWIDTS